MAGKRINLAELADEPPFKEARVPTFADTHPRTARVEQVAANPLNTRDIHANPAKITSIADSIRIHGQLQPCTVVVRAAFLRLFPEHEQTIGNATFVQVTGARRRAAVIEAGLSTIDITVKNDLAESRAKYISATAAENIDREDFDPIEEARVVQLLVAECGTNKAAAEQLSRTPPWVTQRLNLLKLSPPLQAALRAKSISLREVRDLHDLSPEEQLAALAAWQQRTVPAQLTAVNSPDSRVDPPTPGAKGAGKRMSPAAAAIQKLGGTPTKIAVAIRSELAPADVRSLAEELLKDH